MWGREGHGLFEHHRAQDRRHVVLGIDAPVVDQAVLQETAYGEGRADDDLLAAVERLKAVLAVDLAGEIVVAARDLERHAEVGAGHQLVELGARRGVGQARGVLQRAEGCEAPRVAEAELQAARAHQRRIIGLQVEHRQIARADRQEGVVDVVAVVLVRQGRRQVELAAAVAPDHIVELAEDVARGPRQLEHRAARGDGLGGVFRVAVAQRQGQGVVGHGEQDAVGRGVRIRLLFGDGLATGVADLVVQMQQVIGDNRSRSLIAPRARLARVVVGQGEVQREGRGIADPHDALARQVARQNVDGGVVGGQPVDLVQALLEDAQVEHHVGPRREGGGHVDRVIAVVVEDDPLDLALDDIEHQLALLQVLRLNVDPRRGLALVDVEPGDVGKQVLHVAEPEAATRIGRGQPLAARRVHVGRVQEGDGGDGLAAALGGHGRRVGGHLDHGLTARAGQNARLVLVDLLLLLALDRLALLDRRGRRRGGQGGQRREQDCQARAQRQNPATSRPPPDLQPPPGTHAICPHTFQSA